MPTSPSPSSSLESQAPEADPGSRPSYAHGTGVVPLLGETIGENLRSAAVRYGDREALVVCDQSYRATYRELSDQVDLAARAFLGRGVQKGDRVGIWAPNRFEWMVTQFATAQIGAILVTINPAYKAVELAHALNQAGVSVLLLARSFREADYVEMLAQVRERIPSLRQAIIIDEDWEAFVSEGHQVVGGDLRERAATLQFDEPINIQYTSGTTGFPKGATLSHHNILNNAYFVAQTLNYTEADRACVPVPFYHCFGMVLGNLACVTRGACVVVPSAAFEPRAVLEAVQTERCTSLYGVPTMFIAELEHPEFAQFDLSSLRTGMMGGAPCPVDVMNKVRAEMHMEEVTIICGMTETAPVSTQTAVDDPIEKRVSTVGRVHPHLEVKVIDPSTGTVVPRGLPGEQCTRGYSVMLGYWDDPAATSKAIDSAGWMHTGDLAVMDDEGYLTIVGRIKDMIIRGGENIYPREVEEFLHQFPEIIDVQVIGIPSQRYGEEVMAWIRLRDGATLSDEQLIEACRGRIAHHKIPRYWKRVDSFPMTVTGKIQKFRMRESAVEELGLRSAAS